MQVILEVNHVLELKEQERKQQLQKHQLLQVILEVDPVLELKEQERKQKMTLYLPQQVINQVILRRECLMFPIVISSYNFLGSVFEYNNKDGNDGIICEGFLSCIIQKIHFDCHGKNRLCVLDTQNKNSSLYANSSSYCGCLIWCISENSFHISKFLCGLH